MPFCSQCGGAVTGQDFYCGKCGARQPIPGQPGAYSRAGEGITPRSASVLCYAPFIGWIASLFVLGTQKFRERADVRFHAFQGLYLFVAWLLLEHVPWFSALPFPYFPIRKILKLALLGVSVFMMVKASRDERFSLPVIGDLAERSL